MISLQKRRRKEFHRNGTPGPMSSTLNITEPDVDMENKGSKALGDIVEDEEDIHPKDKGKSKRIHSDDNEEDEDIASTGKIRSSKPGSTSSYLSKQPIRRDNSRPNPNSSTPLE